MAEKKNVLVIGSSGFLGSHIIKKLNDALFEIVRFDKTDNQDILKREDLEKAPAVEIVIHLAAKTYIPDAFMDPGSFYHENINGAINILEYCRKNKVEKLIFASTYVYGEPVYLPVDEKHPLDIMNPYTRSKYICELLIEGYCRDFGLNAVIFRIFNVYGVGQDERFLIPTILRRFFNNEEQVKMKNLTAKRDFIYIDDVVEVFCRACEADIKGFEIFNIGSGASYSVKEILDLIGKITNLHREVKSEHVLRKGDVKNTLADINKAKEILNWSPRFNLEDGLRDMIKELRKAS